jgi:hypothetical protein
MNPCRLSIAFALLVVGCSAAPSQDREDVAEASQAFNSDPPPPLQCDYPEMACGTGRCVDVQSDNGHCGWCFTECNVGLGEFCRNYHCVNVADYGFEIHPRGPRPYNPIHDLPRPATD